MLIECLTDRGIDEGGRRVPSRVVVGGTAYEFIDNGEGALVCDVQPPAVVRFLIGGTERRLLRINGRKKMHNKEVRGQPHYRAYKPSEEADEHPKKRGRKPKR